MPKAVRIMLAFAFGMLAFSQIGCNLVPRNRLAMSQHRSRQLWEQNKALAMEREQLARQMGTDNQRLTQQNGELQASRDALQRRVDNLLAERGKIKGQLAGTSPLSQSTTRQFEDLARRFPGFEFDPQTGVSKFATDVCFKSGTDEITPETARVLLEFAKVMNTGEAQQLNILVTGHTDDRPVVKRETKERHPDNWYLSGHRAIAVLQQLKRYSIKESRMGAAGYGQYQPIARGRDPKSLEKNRRVEIYVLAPNATVAGVDAGVHVHE